MKILLITFMLAGYACNNANQNQAATDSITALGGSIKTIKDTLSNKGVNDSIINISFPKDSTWVTVSGKMKGINHPVTVYIPVKQGNQLIASLSTEDSLANIRINQIFTPEGKADGPFGKELKHTLHQQGTYKLIIGENMMQGDEWKGKFNLTVKVQ